MANQVTLTFAGESKGLEQTTQRVGQATEDMDRKVRSSGDGFERASERFDDMDTKAMGFRDSLTGIEDGAKGVKQAAAGDWGFETLLLLGFGIGDLASGMVNFLVPAVKSATTAIRGMSLAMFTSPVFWIIAAIVLLIGVIVLIATKTDWFSRAWRASWNWIKNAAGAAWDWIRAKSAAVWAFLQRIPGNLRSAFARVAGFLTAPFRAAFNAIARAWNNTIGRLSWSVPSWVPFIGGNSISVPNLPTFHAGGTVPGVIGRPVMTLLQAGEQVSAVGSSSGGRGGEEWIRVDLGDLGDALLEPIRKAVSKRGSSVTALGVRVLANGTVR